MTQKGMALTVADDVFKANVTTIFKTLDENLISARDDASKKQIAMDNAKRGLEFSQRTLAACIELANTLP